MTTPAIELKGISKAFGPVQANKDISIRVLPGTIHGIIGENGAGKSTLMSILYGFYKADAGEIFISGHPHPWPRRATSFLSPGEGKNPHFAVSKIKAERENQRKDRKILPCIYHIIGVPGNVVIAKCTRECGTKNLEAFYQGTSQYTSSRKSYQVSGYTRDRERIFRSDSLPPPSHPDPSFSLSTDRRPKKKKKKQNRPDDTCLPH